MKVGNYNWSTAGAGSQSTDRQRYYSIPSIPSLVKTLFLGFLLLCSAPILTAADVNFCNHQNMRDICRGNLGIARNQMPQVNIETESSYLFYKSIQGFRVESASIPAHKFVPTQKEMNKNYVFGMLKSYSKNQFDPCEKSIIAAKGNDTAIHVIDGHHRYAACRILNKNQKTVLIYDEPEKVLHELNIFSGVSRVDLSES